MNVSGVKPKLSPCKNRLDDEEASNSNFASYINRLCEKRAGGIGNAGTRNLCTHSQSVIATPHIRHTWKMLRVFVDRHVSRIFCIPKCVIYNAEKNTTWTHANDFLYILFSKRTKYCRMLNKILYEIIHMNDYKSINWRKYVCKTIILNQLKPLGY